jgi:hypothetical protein
MFKKSPGALLRCVWFADAQCKTGLSDLRQFEGAKICIRVDVAHCPSRQCTRKIYPRSKSTAAMSEGVPLILGADAKLLGHGMHWISFADTIWQRALDGHSTILSVSLNIETAWVHIDNSRRKCTKLWILTSKKKLLRVKNVALGRCAKTFPRIQTGCRKLRIRAFEITLFYIVSPVTFKNRDNATGDFKN